MAKYLSNRLGKASLFQKWMGRTNILPLFALGLFLILLSAVLPALNADIRTKFSDVVTPVVYALSKPFEAVESY